MNVMRITRRKAAGILTGAAVMTPQARPQQASDNNLQAARADLRANATRIAQIKLPMATEPAFRFKA